MKYLILFLILLAVITWIGWRFRRQLTTGWQIWKMLRGAYVKSRPQTEGAPPREKISAGKLVRCEKCETWVPKETALNFGNNTYFCSAKCMEKSVVR